MGWLACGCRTGARWHGAGGLLWARAAGAGIRVCAVPRLPQPSPDGGHRWPGLPGSLRGVQSGENHRQSKSNLCPDGETNVIIRLCPDSVRPCADSVRLSVQDAWFEGQVRTAVPRPVFAIYRLSLAVRRGGGISRLSFWRRPSFWRPFSLPPSFCQRPSSWRRVWLVLSMWRGGRPRRARWYRRRNRCCRRRG